MTDLVIAWENWRSSWYNYEDVIIDLINNKDERWLKIVEFISNDTCISLDEYIFRAIKSPKTVEDAVLNWRKKPPKADAILYFENIKTGNIIIRGISIKSSNINIQVLITNVKMFLDVCKWYWLDISNEYLEMGLSKFCWYWKYKPSLVLKNEDIKKLKQWNRDRRLIQELSENERLTIKNFFNLNQRPITEIILKKGSWPKEYRADYYLVNKTKYSATQIVDFKIDNIENIINRSMDICYNETKQWSFHIWHLTVQMKGSWKWEAYHWLQFNKAWI